MTISGIGYELRFVGAQRETIMNGKLAAALDLRTLADRARLYGLGPLEHLRGEAGFIKSTPQKIIAENTDWRFLNELKRELKA